MQSFLSHVTLHHAHARDDTAHLSVIKYRSAMSYTGEYMHRLLANVNSLNVKNNGASLSHISRTIKKYNIRIEQFVSISVLCMTFILLSNSDEELLRHGLCITRNYVPVLGHTDKV